MKQNTAETFKLTLAIAIFDVLLLLIYFAVVTILDGTADWRGNWVGLSVLFIGYRTASLQPLYLYWMLKLFQQRLNAFSPGIVIALSCVSSLISLFAIGLIFSVIDSGFYFTEWFPQAFEFFVGFIFEMWESFFIPAMFGVLLFSPILVYQARRLLGSDVRVGE